MNRTALKTLFFCYYIKLSFFFHRQKFTCSRKENATWWPWTPIWRAGCRSTALGARESTGHERVRRAGQEWRRICTRVWQGKLSEACFVIKLNFCLMCSSCGWDKLEPLAIRTPSTTSPNNGHLMFEVSIEVGQLFIGQIDADKKWVIVDMDIKSNLGQEEPRNFFFDFEQIFCLDGFRQWTACLSAVRCYCCSFTDSSTLLYHWAGGRPRGPLMTVNIFHCSSCPSVISSSHDFFSPS